MPPGIILLTSRVSIYFYLFIFYVARLTNEQILTISDTVPKCIYTW